ncbi:unnamed protein product, partial [Prorocentrum cordatum]
DIKRIVKGRALHASLDRKLLQPHSTSKRAAHAVFKAGLLNHDEQTQMHRMFEQADTAKHITNMSVVNLAVLSDSLTLWSEQVRSATDPFVTTSMLFDPLKTMATHSGEAMQTFSDMVNQMTATAHKTLYTKVVAQLQEHPAATCTDHEAINQRIDKDMVTLQSEMMKTVSDQ